MQDMLPPYITIVSQSALFTDRKSQQQQWPSHAALCLCVEEQMLEGRLHTFTKGASASFASRLAISVLPQPVGPIMRIFLGTISSCIATYAVSTGSKGTVLPPQASERDGAQFHAFIGLGIFRRRHRLRRAFATAFFASPCVQEHNSGIIPCQISILTSSMSECLQQIPP